MEAAIQSGDGAAYVAANDRRFGYCAEIKRLKEKWTDDGEENDGHDPNVIAANCWCDAFKGKQFECGLVSPPAPPVNGAGECEPYENGSFIPDCGFCADVFYYSQDQ